MRCGRTFDWIGTGGSRFSTIGLAPVTRHDLLGEHAHESFSSRPSSFSLVRFSWWSSLICRHGAVPQLARHSVSRRKYFSPRVPAGSRTASGSGRTEASRDPDRHRRGSRPSACRGDRSQWPRRWCPGPIPATTASATTARGRSRGPRDPCRGTARNTAGNCWPPALRPPRTAPAPAPVPGRPAARLRRAGQRGSCVRSS